MKVAKALFSLVFYLEREGRDAWEMPGQQELQLLEERCSCTRRGRFTAVLCVANVCEWR